MYFLRESDNIACDHSDYNVFQSLCNIDIKYILSSSENPAGWVHCLAIITFHFLSAFAAL